MNEIWISHNEVTNIFQVVRLKVKILDALRFYYDFVLSVNDRLGQRYITT